MQRGPMLVTGLPRSGTSWAGKMLEAGGQVVYINEPMSRSRPPGGSPGVLDASVSHRFQYLDETDDAIWRRAFDNTLGLRFQFLPELRAIRRPYHLARAAKYATAFAVGRRRGRAAMLDDPNAVFASRWLTGAMGVRTLFIVRDPVGMIGSWRQLGWQPQLDELLAQPTLVRDHLAGLAETIEQVSRTGDWLDQMCCFWNVGHGFIGRATDDLEHTTVRRYEDLAAEPIEQFRTLYEWFGLDWSAAAQAAIEEATTASADTKRAFSWSMRGGLSRTAFRRMDSRAAVNRSDHRLDPDEIARVRSMTEETFARFPRATP